MDTEERLSRLERVVFFGNGSPGLAGRISALERENAALRTSLEKTEVIAKLNRDKRVAVENQMRGSRLTITLVAGIITIGGSAFALRILNALDALVKGGP